MATTLYPVVKLVVLPSGLIVPDPSSGWSGEEKEEAVRPSSLVDDYAGIAARMRQLEQERAVGPALAAFDQAVRDGNEAMKPKPDLGEAIRQEWMKFAPWNPRR